MKNVLLAVVLAVSASCMAFATSTDQLEVCINGGSCVVIADTALTDPAGPGGGEVEYSNANFHGWNLQVILGSSNSPDNVDPALDVTSLTATCLLKGVNGCGSNPLDVIYSDVGFTVPAVQWKNDYSTTISGGSGSTTQLAWVDTSNTIFGMPGGGAVGAVGPFNASNAGFTLGGPVTTTSPYSLTLEQIFTDSGKKSATGVTFSSDGALSGVPEPGALILFGTVVVMCASKLRRRIAS